MELLKKRKFNVKFIVLTYKNSLYIYLSSYSTIMLILDSKNTLHLMNSCLDVSYYSLVVKGVDVFDRSSKLSEHQTLAISTLFIVCYE